MLLQMLVIVLLSSWIVEEYLNNIYLQAYVNDVIQADGSLIAVLVLVSTLGVAFGLFRMMRSSHKRIGALVSQPQARMLNAAVSRSGPALTLHPMVAALKADMAHQGSMEPLPEPDVKDAHSIPPQVPPAPAPVRTVFGTPSTVITGTMPVLKRVNPDRDESQSSQQ